MNLHSTRREFLKFGAASPLAVATLRTRCANGYGFGTETKAPPKRILLICNSLGFYKNFFYPRKTGDFSSSDYLKELQQANKVTLLENLFHPGMETSNHDSEKSFLTGTPRPEANGFANDISLDQVISKRIGDATRFPFLNFSLYDRGWGCSWNDRGSAIPPMNDEETIFNLLFGPEDLQARKQQIENDKLILKSLKRDLNTITETRKDANQTETYKKLIVELQNQLKHDEFWLNAKKPKVKKTLVEGGEFGFSNKVSNLFELAKLAFRTDSTRVITLTMDWVYGAIKVPGATGGWHSLSHHGGRPDVLKDLRCIESDIIKHFDRFLTDLSEIKEGSGSLLDHTTVVLGSNFGDASNHTCHKLPILVAGGGYDHQAQRVLKKPTPLCNLWLELLQDFDIDEESFGSSTGNMQLLQS